MNLKFLIDFKALSWYYVFVRESQADREGKASTPERKEPTEIALYRKQKEMIKS